MANRPKWVRHPQTALEIPTGDVRSMIDTRLEDARTYQEAAEQELEQAKHALGRCQFVYDEAKKQHDYWLMIKGRVEDWDG